MRLLRRDGDRTVRNRPAGDPSPHAALAVWMAKYGWTQEQLGEAVGASRAAVYWWLSGRSVPNVAHATRIAALGGPAVEDWTEDE